jgi:hypothetical protein
MRYLFLLLFISIVMGLGVTYYLVSDIDFKAEKEISPTNKIEKKREDIIKLLADSKKIDRFPAKELYFKVDLNYIPKTRILYQMVLNTLDRYQLFGVEQILKLNNLDYSIIRYENNLKLFINFAKKREAEKVQKLFKNYNFNVTLKEVKIKG